MIILRHPQEDDKDYGTAVLLEQCFRNATIVQGLSWRSWSDVLERAKVQHHGTVGCAVLYPYHLPPFEGTVGVFKEGKTPMPASALKVVVVLDGTWSQAKTLWWRNPWLLKLDRIGVQPTQPSIYGRLRKEPKRHYLSTLESVAEIHAACTGQSETKKFLHTLMRTMVQRARDADHR